MHHPKLTLVLPLALVTLSACEGTVYALRNAEASASRGIARLSDRVNPQPVALRRPAEPRYCYVVMGDVVCYRDPLPGEDTRLVGYQEPLMPMGSEPPVTVPRSIKNDSPPAVVGSVTPVSPRPSEMIVPPAPSVATDPESLEPLRL